MSFKTETRGLWVATLTPLTADGAVDTARLATHVRTLFAAGVDGVAPFGTTGEGQSFSTAERKATLEALLRAGVAADKIIVGIGCAALPDAIDLARHALSQGVTRVLQLPPFFFKGIDAAGVEAAFARTIDGVADDRLRLFLYHIPQVSAAPIHHAAIARLVERFPKVVAGIKDSAAEWPHTQTILRQFPQLAIFVGCEAHVPQALANGGVGTICGMGNLVPHLMRRIVDTAGKPGNDELVGQIGALVKPIGSRPFIAASKAVLANATSDPAWRTVRAPLVTLSAEDEKALLAEFAQVGVPIYRAAA